MATIRSIVSSLRIPPSSVRLLGDCAKVDWRLAKRRQRGKLILVTSASTPTPFGTGKTTVAISLADALRKRKPTIVTLRQPSLGPVFGIKGGATGGGKSSLTPADKVNLHFTGDFHAVAAAQNLLVALLEAHIYAGNSLQVDVKRPMLRECEDVNNRGLRRILRSPDGKLQQQYESGFTITAASEMMAIFALASDIDDLKERVSRMVVGFTTEGKPVRAVELGCADAIAGCLLEALNPNLVQTLEGTPAFVHAGPFANIAHGCCSILSMKAALSLADYVVTEAGFAEELGSQKFADIVCRSSGLKPSAVVAVVNVRDLKRQGGLDAQDGKYPPSTEALAAGLPNLRKHLANLRSNFSGAAPLVVALNRFSSDTKDEVRAVEDACREDGVPCVLAEGYLKGSRGMTALAAEVIKASSRPSRFRFSYGNPGEEKPDVFKRVAHICEERYGVAAEWPPEVRQKLQSLLTHLGDMEVCIAKGFLSITPDDKVRPIAAAGQKVTVRDVEVSAGAGFYVILLGDIMRMPALPAPEKSRASQMRIAADSKAFGGYRLLGV